MNYHFKIHKEPEGYWAECLELAGCQTQAGSQKDLEINMMEALNLFLDEPPESNLVFPLPNPNHGRKKNTRAVKVAPRIAFAVLLRYARSQRGLTQKQAARLMGMDQLYSYQRLESRKANPRLDTLEKVKKAFPEFDLSQVV